MHQHPSYQALQLFHVMTAAKLEARRRKESDQASTVTFMCTWEFMIISIYIYIIHTCNHIYIYNYIYTYKYTCIHRIYCGACACLVGETIWTVSHGRWIAFVSTPWLLLAILGLMAAPQDGLNTKLGGLVGEKNGGLESFLPKSVPFEARA
jgi:hypothetical protein